MSLKMKLISTISAFILVVSLMLVGILAAGSGTLNIGGNVSFTSNSVYAQITGSIVGTAEHPTGSPLSLSTIDIDYTDTETAIDLSGVNKDWTTMPLNFDENASAITIKMNIENKATDRAIKITLTDNTSIGNVKVVRKYNDTTFEESTNTQTINGGEVARYEFTLSVQSQNNQANGQFSINVALENTSTVEKEYNAQITNNYLDIYVWTDTTEQVLLEKGQSITVSGRTVSLSFDPDGTLIGGHPDANRYLYIGDIVVDIFRIMDTNYFSIGSTGNPYGSGDSDGGTYMILNYDLDNDIVITIG